MDAQGLTGRFSDDVSGKLFLALSRLNMLCGARASEGVDLLHNPGSLVLSLDFLNAETQEGFEIDSGEVVAPSA
jgi:hypothetical protein